MKTLFRFENTGILFDFEDCSMHFFKNLTYDQMHRCLMTQAYKFLYLFLRITFLYKKDPISFGKLYHKMKNKYNERYSNLIAVDFDEMN